MALGRICFRLLQLGLLAVILDSSVVSAGDWPATQPASTHWAFTKPVRQSAPQVKQADWPKNAIDRFVLAKLEAQGLRPSPEAEKATLIRRVYLDLIGLPPTPAEVDSFIADTSSNAYEKVVDHLLASPHYGERWGKHWLDAARYADSNGYSIDAPRTMWKYRDWVINAMNSDMPFDEFVVEQVAGDMLPNATREQKIATGFHRNTQINQEGGIDQEQFRVEAIVDRINTTGSVFLGLTIGCAQCHNHKFDPISQRDYYRFFALFNNCVEPELKVPLENEAHVEELSAKLAAVEADQNAALKVSKEKAAHLETTLTPEEIERLDPEARDAVKTPADKRTKKQKAAILSVVEKADVFFLERDRQITAYKKDLASRETSTLVMQEGTPRTTWMFIKGDFTRHGEVVTAAVPGALPQLQTEKPTRLDMARWLVDANNPLTARVTVNRMWMHYFGLGLVETENDFGTQGTPPSNQPLLDWLACELIEPSSAAASHWSQKAMHRLIVTSATYRQSSRARPELAELDPYNRLLARQSRVRLDAEIVRDASLTASGLLTPTVGGPSVYPPQPEGVMGLGQLKRQWVASAGADRYRRGLYTFLFRATPHPLLTSFDATNAIATCTRRLRSNTPLQALILLNDEASFEAAKALAIRVVKEGPNDDAGRVYLAFRLCTSRTPTADEASVLLNVLQQERADMTAKPEEARRLSGKDISPADAANLAAWAIVSRVILNLDETITRE